MALRIQAGEESSVGKGRERSGGEPEVEVFGFGSNCWEGDVVRV